jgi:hypothetical protein
MQEDKTIHLRKPITVGQGDGAITYPELKLREPTAGELEKASRADTGVGVMINLVSSIAKIPRTAVEQLSQRDLAEVNEYLSGFTNPGAEAAGET